MIRSILIGVGTGILWLLLFLFLKWLYLHYDPSNRTLGYIV